MHKLLPLLGLLFLFSCSVQKRHYQKGYFISWNKHGIKQADQQHGQAGSARTNRNVQPLFAINRQPEEQELVTAGASLAANAPVLKKQARHFRATDSCDVIVFRDGSELSAKITEVGATQIKYKKCELAEGPLYISNKSEIFMLKYANGTREVFRAPETDNTPRQQQPAASTRPAKKNTSLATRALVFSILGFYPLVIVGGIVAIVSSLIQLNRITLYPEIYGAEQKARVALILGIVSIVAWVFVIAAIITLGL